MYTTEQIKTLGLKGIHLGDKPLIISDFVIYSIPMIILFVLVVFFIIRIYPIVKVTVQIIYLYFRSSKFPQEVNKNLKIIAIYLKGRVNVANLSSTKWLEFLDNKSLSNFTKMDPKWNELLYGKKEINLKEKNTIFLNAILWIISNFWRALWFK